jgi:cobalt-zinc-cadmium efflux system membrane fusion protein
MKSITTILFLLTALTLSGCYRPNVEPEIPGPKVEGERLILPGAGPTAPSISSEPATQSAPIRKFFNGRLLWNDDLTVRVFSPFTGRVTKVLVNGGEHVERESPLALIASPDFGQAQSDARKAESDFNQAERNANRLRELFEHGAAAKKDLDSAEGDLVRFRAERERTLSRLQFYGGSSTGVDQIFPLKSPLAGIVVEKNINPGQEVRPDQMLANVPQFFTPLIVVTDPSRLWVQLDAAENDLRLLKRGRRILIRSQGLPEEKFTGKIDIISESLDPATHTIKVRGSVDNPGRKLKAEMFVTIELPGEEFPELKVPSKAIFLRGEKHFIFIEEKPGMYRRREVKVGEEEGNSVAVIKGINPGDRVVSEGSLLLEQIFQRASGR